MKLKLTIAFLLAFATAANAQPATTYPNAVGMVTSTCTTGYPILSGGSGSVLACGSGTLGTAAYVNTGTSAGTIPLLNGNWTASGTVNFSGTFEIGGATLALPVSLANGGTNAALTASAGGVVYSTASAFAVLAGTVTASQCLLSGSNAPPTWGSCSGAAAVSSVADSGAGTTTITPTTGSVTVALNLGNANTWTAAQTFTSSDLILKGSGSGTTILNANATAGSTTATLPANTGIIAELNYAQTWSAVQTFTNADLSLAGSSSGNTLLEATAAAGSGTVATFPPNTGIVAELNYAQTWSAVQTFTNADLSLAGSSTGNTLLEASATAGSGTVATFPANTGIVAELNLAQTWTAVQTFTNSDVRLLGSSTGYTTFTSANASASNYTMTVPAATDTLALLGTASQALTGGVHLTGHSYGTVTTGTVTVDCGYNPEQYLINGGSFTLAAPSAGDGQCLLFVRNNSSAGTITFSGFTVGSNTGASLTTTNGNLFSIFIWRITDGTGSTAGYSVYAHQ